MAKALFLDRDGVINHRIVGGYVRNTNEFVFLDGVLEAISILARKFDYVLVVTNQQGIAKGLMTEYDLEAVHAWMLQQIEQHDGTIDAVYYCPLHQRDNPACRKPNIGMAVSAKKDFPDIDFEHSVMVGDSVSDIQFGLNMGMQTVLIETKKDIDKEKLALLEHTINYRCSALIDYAKLL